MDERVTVVFDTCPNCNAKWAIFQREYTFTCACGKHIQVVDGQIFKNRMKW